MCIHPEASAQLGARLMGIDTLSEKVTACMKISFVKQVHYCFFETGFILFPELCLSLVLDFRGPSQLAAGCKNGLFSCHRMAFRSIYRLFLKVTRTRLLLKKNARLNWNHKQDDMCEHKNIQVVWRCLRWSTMTVNMDRSVTGCFLQVTVSPWASWLLLDR